MGTCLHSHTFVCGLNTDGGRLLLIKPHSSIQAAFRSSASPLGKGIFTRLSQAGLGVRPPPKEDPLLPSGANIKLTVFRADLMEALNQVILPTFSMKKEGRKKMAEPGCTVREK